MAITPADLASWLDITEPTGDKLVSFQRVIDAVESNIARTHTAPDPVSPDWEQAHLMQAARWWKRRASPEGIISFDEIGALRIARLDGDVETMLVPFRKFGFA